MKEMGKEKGQIALLTAIILGSIMIVSVALMSREILSEIKVTQRLDASINAFYAADSGIEYGLLRYRFDRNVETPEGKVWRINMETDEVKEVDEGTPIPKEWRNIQVIDVKISYKTEVVGNDANGDGRVDEWDLDEENYKFKLYQDEVVEYDISELKKDDPLNIGWYVPWEIGAGNAMAVEIMAFDKNGNEICIDKTINPDTGDPFCRYMNLNLPGKNLDTPTRYGTPGSPQQYPLKLWKALTEDESKAYDFEPYKLRIKAWFVTAVPDPETGTYVGGNPDLVTLEGGVPYITYFFKAPAGKKIGGAITRIEATGYYQGVKRRLVAEVDRQTGTVIGLFDFVLYSGESLEKPTIP